MDGLVIVLAILLIGTSTYSFLERKKLKEQVATHTGDVTGATAQLQGVFGFVEKELSIEWVEVGV